MPPDKIDVVPCPPLLARDALALALADLTPEQQRDFGPAATHEPIEGLVAAVENGELRGAAWGQRQPGSTAILWPPRFVDTFDANVCRRLVQGVASALDAAGVRMTQVLLQDESSTLARTLQSAGFKRLTELQYLSWEAVAADPTHATSIEFEPYSETLRPRLAMLIEQTYEASQDCPALGGERPMDEVLDGYRATGTFRPETWLFVRDGARDIGVLLLAEHASANHWELLYMGLIPAARGRGLGCAVVRYAQALARAAGAERIVLAVDAENFPAIKMYNETGFVAWDRRTVFVRFAGGDSESQNSS
jgi:ribosomal protein S18 acetylase RimI-like enzyme